MTGILTAKVGGAWKGPNGAEAFPIGFVQNTMTNSAADHVRSMLASDPEVRATQERLQACSYAMAHPESDMLVPACAQHGVLDPEENRELAVSLPMATG